MGRLPVLKKCCFCIPLRSGLLVWGYIKLVLGALILTVSGLLIHELREYLIDYQRGVTLVLLILSVEIIEHIVLIIGAHKKNVAMLQMYFLYAIYILVILIALCVACTVLIFLNTRHPSENETRKTLLLANFLSNTAGIVMQIYIILAVRSEIIKLRSNCTYKYVKEIETVESAKSKTIQQCDDKVILIDNDNNITQ